MNKYLLALLLIFSAFPAKSEVPELSGHSKVVMFTCGSGAELYAGFGHNAIWISDHSLGIDRLYNYGTFDFSTPHFYWKFIKGKLNYMLTVTTLQRFISEYKYRKIEVNGQTLNLTLEEKQRLFELLEENLLPENRFYKYDFFYDNCATRIRDIVIKTVEGKISFNTKDKHLSFRKILFPYLTYTPWTKMGIDLILGLSADKIATPYEYMYMPEYMYKEFKNATIQDKNGIRKLIKSEDCYLRPRLRFSYYVLNDPIILFSFLFIATVVITFFEVHKKHYLKWFDVTLNIIAVLAGLFLFFMWVGTDHSATKQNLNVLWLFPAQALFLIALLFKNERQVKLVWISFSMMVVMGVAMYFWPQETEISFFIIVVIYAFRYLFHQRLLNAKETPLK